MINRPYRVTLILIFWPALLLANDQDPGDVIRNATDKVLAQLSATPDARHDPVRLSLIIEAHILPLVDFAGLSRLTLGKHWGRATGDQRAEFVREFRTLLLRTYSTSLTEYANHRVEYLSSNMSPDNRRASVRTRIVENGKPPIAIDYSLRQVENSWKIYDVSIEGVSLAVNYRTSFAQAIRSHGLDGLIQHLAAPNTTGCVAQGETAPTIMIAPC